MNIKDFFRDKTRDIFHKKLTEINVDCYLSKKELMKKNYLILGIEQVWV